MDLKSPPLGARHLGEHAYCPRLYYLMDVEGIWLPNADTEQGRQVHRKVDKASTWTPEERPEAIRSLHLTCQTLNLTAKCDLVEETPAGLRIVEYRKGSPKEGDIGLEPWPTDLVQVGAQVLVLEANGMQVREAALWYDGIRRRIVVALEDARQAARTELARVENTRKGPRPPPLRHDPRCRRCSLQPICLPDEILALGTGGVVDPSRKVWPPRDDQGLVIVQDPTAKVGIRDGRLKVQGDRSKGELPLVEVRALVILGHAQVSSQALHALAEEEIPVLHCTGAGRLVAQTYPPGQDGGRRWMKQRAVLSDPAAQRHLAGEILASKILNQRTLLRRNHPAPETVDLPQMRLLADQARTAQDTSSRLGAEGAAAAIYFGAFSDLLPSPFKERFADLGRHRRPPRDPANALLSFLYSLLAHEATVALVAAGLSPAAGVLHAEDPRRPALALDLMEPFRPLVADSLCITLLRTGEIGLGHFHDTAAGCVLTDHGRKALFAAYGRRLDTEITHPALGYTLTYRRMLHLHARLIRAWIEGDIATVEFLRTR